MNMRMWQQTKEDKNRMTVRGGVERPVGWFSQSGKRSVSDIPLGEQVSKTLSKGKLGNGRFNSSYRRQYGYACGMRQEERPLNVKENWVFRDGGQPRNRKRRYMPTENSWKTHGVARVLNGCRRPLRIKRQERHGVLPFC